MCRCKKTQSALQFYFVGHIWWLAGVECARPLSLSAASPWQHTYQKATMSEELQADFDGGDAGASNVYPAQCSSLRKNGHVVIKNRACKIVEMSTSKTGKHGHAKVHLIGIDLFTGKKYEDICPSTHNMDVPVVKRADYQLIDISDDGFLSLMMESGELRDDIKIPEGDLGTEIRNKFESNEDLLLTVLAAMGQEMVVATKPNMK
ncbi:eukaryotic translation initiation factor 5A-1 isoform X1 [Palaemon carinicauda]|uniref:eukaryotic translation initiation factor 5A-1 isoform X1 n=2 Tax=Palaemon carinicauda TaxID=392227 RepID=UPI0035B69E20